MFISKELIGHKIVNGRPGGPMEMSRPITTWPMFGEIKKKDKLKKGRRREETKKRLANTQEVVVIEIVQ